MPEKYHINTKPIPPRLPRIGKYGVIDWREDCARCHNCVKKACIYDKYREENEFIHTQQSVDALFFECRRCLSCVQDCTKNLLSLTINSEYKKLGNQYWTPDIIRSTWFQAETGNVPVSGSGYRGRFSGPGFDSMWTDMSEIVRPTRDGIHGREYISTSVDVGRKSSFLGFKGNKLLDSIPPLVCLPFPVIFDMMPKKYGFPILESFILEAASRTGLMAIIDSQKWSYMENKFGKYLKNIVYYLNPSGFRIPDEILNQTRLVEIPDSGDVFEQIKELKKINPEIVISIRIELSSEGILRVMELAKTDIEVIHIVADLNGNEIGEKQPRFIKDMIREIHTALIENGCRDQITIIAGGGIALAEHLAKAVICGADLVSIDLPLLISLECRLCEHCNPETTCPAKLDNIDLAYGAGRMTNLIGSWHWQLVEVMGAMGMREVRRLRGDVGRAMFYEELEKEIFGEIFNQDK